MDFRMGANEPSPRAQAWEPRRFRTPAGAHVAAMPSTYEHA